MLGIRILHMASTFGTRQGHRRNSEEWRIVTQDKKFASIPGEAAVVLVQ